MLTPTWCMLGFSSNTVAEPEPPHRRKRDVCGHHTAASLQLQCHSVCLQAGETALPWKVHQFTVLSTAAICHLQLIVTFLAGTQLQLA